ncbi:MAG: family 2 glycosyl transferase [Candidatus Peregrinibacteria bacterium GW2011_GWC2_33_13]|nr:MAG: family 2 glycosyl transferase [Candidatus Peregrinibacteria bacterium GW2011_GWC2_33_13]
MDVSIILVNYNTKELTRDCIKSVYEKTDGIEYDIWVVDNDSSDGSPQMIKEEFPDVKLIESHENLGFGRANNLVIEQSDAKYCFLLNTDTILVNNAVKILFDFMEKPENSDVGGCGGQLYNTDMSLQDSVGEFDTLDKLYKKALGANFIEIFYRYKHIFKTKILKHKETLKEDKSYSLASDYNPDFIIGADLMLRKSALNQVGAFDKQFFMFGEEAELCFRLKKNKFKIKFVPESSIIHFGGASSAKSNNQLKIEKMVLTGTVLFYKLCYGENVAKKAKLLYMIYYLRYLPLRFFSTKAFQRLNMALNVKI